MDVATSSMVDEGIQTVDLIGTRTKGDTAMDVGEFRAPTGFRVRMFCYPTVDSEECSARPKTAMAKMHYCLAPPVSSEYRHGLADRSDYLGASGRPALGKFY